MTITDKYVLFWDGVLSNWHYVTDFVVEVNGEVLVFPTSEHLFMYLKAIYFDDEDIAEKILIVPTPKAAKKLGRQVKGFSDKTWNTVKEDLMYKCLELKCKACPEFKDELLKDEYKDKIFVEASPFDKIWGIGLDEHNPDSKDETKWRGLNLLGKTLTKLRDDIRGNKTSV